MAALGTSFTAEQAAELRKYADYVFLCFDGDAAGSAAATKAIDVASKEIEHSGSSVRIVLLPPGEDPDSFIRQQGAEAFRALLEAAKPALQFRIDGEIERLRAGFDSPARVAPKAEALIRALAPREEWDRWRVYVAGRLQVNVDDLRNSRFLADSANFAPQRAALAQSRHAGASVEPLSFEREVLSILLEEPALAVEYGSRIGTARFRNEVYRRVYERIVEASGTMTDDGRRFRALRGGSRNARSSCGGRAARSKLCGALRRTARSGAHIWSEWSNGCGSKTSDDATGSFRTSSTIGSQAARWFLRDCAESSRRSSRS